MADSLAPAWLVRLGEYLQEESENQWFWFSAFVVTMLVGAFWIQASLVLPGISSTGLLDEGETLEAVEWSADGESALVLVGWADTSPVRYFEVSQDASATFRAADTGTLVPTALCAHPGGWLIGGEGGQVGSYDGTTFELISLDWGNQTPADVVDIACLDDGSGWLVTGNSRQTSVHTFLGGVVSTGTSAPTDSTVMTSVSQSPDGSSVIVTGFDTALATPTLGPQGEIVIRADAVLGQKPNLVTLHHGAGGQIHTVAFVDSSTWGGEVDALLAGGSNALLLKSDSTIVTLPGVGGSTAAAVDSSGTFWFASGESTELLSLSQAADGPEMHTVSQSSVVDARMAWSVGDDVVFYGEGVDGNVGTMQLDPSADSDVSRSLARMGDLLFLMIVIFAVAVIGHSVYVKGLKPW
jgi:hypothetical protein